MDDLNSNLLPCWHITLPYITGFDIKAIHQRTQTTRSHASHCHHSIYCHYCNLDFVLFHNVKCYTKSLLSCIHANNTYLLNIACTSVSTCVILRRLVCTTWDSWTKLEHPTSMFKVIGHWERMVLYLPTPATLQFHNSMNSTSPQFKPFNHLKKCVENLVLFGIQIENTPPSNVYYTMRIRLP
jgi:hypothetical protein